MFPLSIYGAVAMLDAFYLLFGIILFALMALYARACDWL